MSVSSSTTVTTDGDTATARVSGRFSISKPAISFRKVSKPVYAYLGGADFALAQVKEIPAELVGASRKIAARLAEVPTAVRTLPAQAKEIPAELTDASRKAQVRLAEVPTAVRTLPAQAGEFYAALAIRGERLVTQIRRQPATQAAMAEGKEAVKKAEAAATAAKKSARAGEQALEDAAAKLG